MRVEGQRRGLTRAGWWVLVVAVCIATLAWAEVVEERDVTYGQGDGRDLKLDLESDETEINGIKVVVREVPAAPANEIRNMADVLRAKIGSGVVVIGLKDGDKVNLVTAVSSDLVDRLHAGKLAQRIAGLVGGKGGGRADFAQAGGKGVEKLHSALESVPDLVREELEG